MVKGLLLLLLLQEGLMELQEGSVLLVLLLLQAELKMVRLLLVDWEGSEAGPSDFDYALGWHCSKKGRHWSVQGCRLCYPLSQGSMGSSKRSRCSCESAD